MSANRSLDYDAEVGTNLRALRLSYTVKQTDLAARLGVQRAAVTRWEQGTRGLTVEMLLQIADTFGIPASRLLPDRHREPGAAPAPGAQRVEAPYSQEESAIANIVQVLRERPELIVSQEPGAAPAPGAQYVEAPQSLEERAIASIARVLRERPELIVSVMQFLEQQAFASDQGSTR